eukprot:CAMPEP_0206211584 /NCGR_PEP_ID=MMETSP0047_2-20121206/65_1 /ASSEMBLY_ACC=CAM_ASM_000192 /TAXON_ID=195065 /ORGANISM="Chroomonas mesostigmatica_cf, Strain CCMP1168" /LENGTH=58 /DNA_ID=CAMNT_0053633473 /DNA_START=411 /DNA_END=583 /DNA_ORIENTATION=+
MTERYLANICGTFAIAEPPSPALTQLPALTKACIFTPNALSGWLGTSDVIAAHAVKKA